MTAQTEAAQDEAQQYAEQAEEAMSVRDHLIEVIAEMSQDDYGDTADAIMQRFPWVAQSPGVEWGVRRMAGAGGVITFWKHEAEAFAARTGWPLVSRRLYRTEWEETT